MAVSENLEEDLTFHTQQGYYPELLDTTGVLLLWNPDTFRMLPGSRHASLPPNHSEGLPESYEESWAPRLL